MKYSSHLTYIHTSHDASHESTFLIVDPWHLVVTSWHGNTFHITVFYDQCHILCIHQFYNLGCVSSILWWRHDMEMFSALLVTSQQRIHLTKGHQCKAMKISLLLTWTSFWINNWMVSELKQLDAHVGNICTQILCYIILNYEKVSCVEGDAKHWYTGVSALHTARNNQCLCNSCSFIACYDMHEI